MTCDCQDPVVFGHHHYGDLHHGEQVVTVAEYMRRYTEVMQTLTRALDMHRAPP